jgi:hypothetical protein
MADIIVETFLKPTCLATSLLPAADATLVLHTGKRESANTSASSTIRLSPGQTARACCGVRSIHRLSYAEAMKSDSHQVCVSPGPHPSIMQATTNNPITRDGPKTFMQC